MPRNIGLPAQRVEQLEALAAKWNMTVADVIGKMINQQIDQGELPADVPGIKVVRKGSEVKLVAGDLNFKSSRTAFLDEAAGLIRGITQPSKKNALIPLPEGFGVTRRGTSVKITDGKGGEETLAPSIAFEVADQLERAAKS